MKSWIAFATHLTLMVRRAALALWLLSYSIALADAKLPIPDAATLETASKLVSDIYKDELANAKRFDDKVALAQKLLLAGAATKNDPAGRYALFVLARDLAIESGSSETAMAAVEATANTYNVDSLASKVEVLRQLSKSSRLQSKREVLYRATDQTIDEAVAVDRYDIAKQTIELAMEIAKSNRTLTNLAMARTREIREIEAAHIDATAAKAVLEKSPTDPAANLSVGRFYCSFKGNWENGLPLLALGSDKELKSIAEAEINGAVDADSQAALADRWWEQGAKETGVAKRHIQLRAAKWYKEAVPQLQGLSRAKAEKRLQELGPIEKATSEGTPVVVLAAAAVRADPNIRRDDPYWGKMTIGFHWAEWEPEFDVEGKWYVYVLMASNESRPGTFVINGESQPPQVLGEITGGFHLRNAKWVKCGPYEFKKGKNVFRLQFFYPSKENPARQLPGTGPSIKGFVFSPSPNAKLSEVKFGE